MNYLRVKNWSQFQHYSKRRPPWIKLYGSLLDDDVFLGLSELEQWQLVRIWMFASKASRFTIDEKGTVVPVVVFDEVTLRRGTRSVKKIPLVRFVTEGWLIPVAESDLVDVGHEIADVICLSLASTVLDDC